MDIVGCAICHDSFDGKQPSVITQCGHVFDEKCLSEWLRNHPHCPTCRRSTEKHCVTKVHFSMFKNENRNCSDDLRKYLDMRHALSKSTVEQLRKDLEAVEIEKRTLLDDAKTNVQQLSLLRKKVKMAYSIAARERAKNGLQKK